MYYTYVLLCSSKNLSHEFYYGSTSDLRQRLKDHIDKKTETTRKFDKLELIYYEACLNEEDTSDSDVQMGIICYADDAHLNPQCPMLQCKTSFHYSV